MGRRDAAHRPGACHVTREGHSEDTDRYSSRLEVGFGLDNCKVVSRLYAGPTRSSLSAIKSEP